MVVRTQLNITVSNLPPLVVRSLSNFKGGLYVGEICISLNVFFEGEFYVGIFEKRVGEKLSVCKVTFGSEPKDYEVYDFLVKNFYNLKFSNPVEVKSKVLKKINPKRLQRLVKKQVKAKGVGTKSQEALKMQYQENKMKSKKDFKEQEKEKKELKFLIRQKKRKNKHKGR